MSKRSTVPTKNSMSMTQETDLGKKMKMYDLGSESNRVLLTDTGSVSYPYNRGKSIRY